MGAKLSQVQQFEREKSMSFLQRTEIKTGAEEDQEGFLSQEKKKTTEEEDWVA